MKSKISIVHLGVKDFQTSLKFYRDGLGFKISGEYKEGEEYVMFDMKGSMFALFSREKLANDAKVDSSGSGFSGFTLSHNATSQNGRW